MDFAGSPLLHTLVVIAIVAVVLLGVSYWLLPRPEKGSGAVREGYADNDFWKKLYGADMAIRSQSTLNCYDYMMSNDKTKSWVDQGTEKKSVDRLKVLSTMRTAVNHFDDPAAINTVTMGGCVIPPEVGKTLYNIDSAAGNCTVKDVMNNQSVELTPTPDGCMVDFTSPNFNSSTKFNNMLDVAFNVYDYENQVLIKNLKQQIEDLKTEISNLDKVIKQNNDQRDEYIDKRNKLLETNSDCQKKKRQVLAWEQQMRDAQAKYDEANTEFMYYDKIRQDIDNDVAGIEEEFRFYNQFKG